MSDAGGNSSDGEPTYRFKSQEQNYVQRAKDTILSSSAYALLRRNLTNFVHPRFRTGLRDLVKICEEELRDHNAAHICRILGSELANIHPIDIVFVTIDDRSFLNTIKVFVERKTGEKWDWWPCLPARHPGEQNGGIQWICVSITSAKSVNLVSD